MAPLHRWLLKWSRMVHVYSTLFGLALVLFFAVTGFMLNHEDWFDLSEPRTRTETGALPTDVLQPVDKLAVAERLRKDFAASGEVDTFEEEEDDSRRVRVVFKGPGRRVEALVQVEDGKTTVSYESRGLVGLLTDLHRGKSTGRAWGLVIDGVCVLLLVISATGLVLWSSLRSRGKFGALVFLVGAAASVAVYVLWVP
jgi:hypothetical protein